jgi:translocation and assembly module TamB
MNVGGRIRIERSRVIVQKFQVSTGNSTLAASGSINNFATPTADFEFSTHVQAVDVEKYFPPDTRISGEATLTGSAHYDTSAGVTFQGRAAGRKVSYHSASVDLPAIDLDSDVSGSPARLEFQRFALRSLEATLNGSAELANLTKLNVDAAVARLDLNRAASKLFNRTLPWNAVAEGRIRFSSDFATRIWRNALAARLNLQPAPAWPALSGTLDFTYRTPARLLEFNPSHVNLPGTQLSFSGAPSAVMQVVLESADLTDLGSALAALHKLPIPALPVIERNGSAHFDGTVARILTAPQITGQVALSNFHSGDRHWDSLRSKIGLSSQEADFYSLTLMSGSSRVTGNGRLDLVNWIPTATSQIQLNGRFQGIDLAQPAFQMPITILPAWAKFLAGGIGSGSLAISGRFSNPVGSVQLRIDNADLNGARMNQIQLNAVLESNLVRVTEGRLRSGPAIVAFSGTYMHPAESWRDGRLAIKIDSNGFPLSGVPEWRRLEPTVDGAAEIHGQGAIQIASGQIEPATANGILKVRKLTYNGELFGALTVNAVTSGNVLRTKLAGDLRGHLFSGTAETQLIRQSPMNGEVHFDRLDVASLRAIIYPAQNGTLPFDGTVSGGVNFSGPLLRPRSWRSKLELKDVELRPKLERAIHNASALTLHNVGPVVIDASGGLATIKSFQVNGDNTALTVAGSVHYDSQQALDLRMNGSANLQILQLFDPSLQSSGSATIVASVGGTFAKPSVTGTLDIAQGTLFSGNLPNGLSNVNGRIVFNRDRATIQKINAQVGGGSVSLAGFIGFSGHGPLVYHVQASAADVRLRYGGGISITANADLRLTGSSQSSILSGTATVSRVVLNPNTDVGNLLAAFGAAAVAPANSNEFVSGLHLDLAVESAPNLQLSTALSRDVEAEIDLRLRGTPDHPVLLGSISANQGDIKVFGSKYSINHGEVRFQNTARIEPVLDLDLQTQTRGITVNITISGTMNKLNIAYRSDPPLQPRDIIALLTVGRTPNSSYGVQAAQNPSDLSTAQDASTVLGQAISSPPNRLSKLFGITNVKIDPMVQGIITNTPQARLTLEQQVSRDLTVTYVTNLSQTSEQIFRVEWALNPQYSVVALRDENGEFGIDIQYKKRFR